MALALVLGKRPIEEFKSAMVSWKYWKGRKRSERKRKKVEGI
jgi:hypothetical protein